MCVGVQISEDLSPIFGVAGNGLETSRLAMVQGPPWAAMRTSGDICFCKMAFLECHLDVKERKSYLRFMESSLSTAGHSFHVL